MDFPSSEKYTVEMCIIYVIHIKLRDIYITNKVNLVSLNMILQKNICIYNYEFYYI